MLTQAISNGMLFYNTSDSKYPIRNFSDKKPTNRNITKAIEICIKNGLIPREITLSFDLRDYVFKNKEFENIFELMNKLSVKGFINSASLGVMFGLNVQLLCCDHVKNIWGISIGNPNDKP